MVGAKLATGLTPFDAACQAVYIHGKMADTWPFKTGLTASQLAQHLG
jgi:NAD(P)H-hydrate repair Nnr-like enzyme with NAD(P)H-hydrate dehydratase domain